MEFEFRFTKDKSVGLYNHSVDDIYHSSFGAKTEAIDKFIKPLKFFQNFYHKKNIKVLDICYGIGYNTKAFLEYIKKINYKGQIQIDALEYDENLVAISPFIKDEICAYSPEITYTLLKELGSISLSDKSIKLLLNKKLKPYFNPFCCSLIKKLLKDRYTTDPCLDLNRFLHNIYYHCISPRLKTSSKHLKTGNVKINAHIADARKTVLELNDTYDIVFLDAFTPVKLPTLWSYDFFMELYKLLNNDSMLLTYSNSAAVRHALLDAGYFVGKLYDKNNRSCGTVATKNEKLIEHKLDDYDLGLIKTNAGVYFRDKSLSSSSDEILNEFYQRKKSLNLESSSSYIKKHKKLEK